MLSLEKNLEKGKSWWELERREFIPLYGHFVTVGKTAGVFASATDKLFDQEREDLHRLYRELLFHQAPRIVLSGVYNVALVGLAAIAVDYFSR